MITLGYQSFFDNLDKEKCPVTSCVLLQKDCKTNYTSLDLSMETKSPWRLMVGEKATPNKVESMCIKCSNAFTSTTWDKFTVKQTGSCLNVLS